MDALEPTSPMPKPPTVIVCSVVIAGALMTTGCGENTGRQSLEGNITLDGQPLERGQIIFVPIQGTNSPTAGSAITDGRYSIIESQGPLPGNFRVEIIADRLTSRKKRVPNLATGQFEEVDEYESAVQARYNRNSSLTAEVTADGPNRFDFELKSP